MIFDCNDLWGGWPGFCHWCTTVVPTIFEEGLSYYEQICKLAYTLKGVINQVDQNTADIQDLKDRLEVVETWIQDFIDGGTSSWDELLAKYFQTPIFIGLTSTGHFLFTIPSAWSQIAFNTTGYDCPYLSDGEYGHLILSY